MWLYYCADTADRDTESDGVTCRRTAGELDELLAAETDAACAAVAGLDIDLRRIEKLRGELASKAARVSRVCIPGCSLPRELMSSRQGPTLTKPSFSCTRHDAGLSSHGGRAITRVTSQSLILR